MVIKLAVPTGAGKSYPIGKTFITYGKESFVFASFTFGNYGQQEQANSSNSFHFFGSAII